MSLMTSKSGDAQRKAMLYEKKYALWMIEQTSKQNAKHHGVHALNNKNTKDRVDLWIKKT